MPDNSPTRVRYQVVFVTTMMSFVLYLHRYFLSFIERFIKQDLLLTDTQIGLLLSCFFWAYGLGQVPGGWLSDRFGARKMLCGYIVVWSVLTGLVGLVNSFLLIVLLRLAFGLAQAGAYPTSAGIISKWSPFPVRGVISSIIAMGGRIGGVAAPVLTAYLLLSFVSVSTPSQLKPSDILSPDGLIQRLSHKKTGHANRVLQLLPPVTAKGVGAGSVPGAELVTAFNGLITQPGLHDKLADAELKLDGEAATIAKIPTPQRTAAQSERLNRLMLETIFPNSIKKIYGSGWRPVIFLYCGLGLLIALLFWLVARDRPAVHPWSNESEVKLIEESRPKGTPSPHGRVGKLPWRNILTNFSLWCSSLSQFATVFGHIFVLTWFPRYLAEVHRVPVMGRAVMVSLPMAAGMLGMMAGGWWTDWFTRRFGLRRGRSWPLAIARFAGMLSFAACAVFDSRWGVTISLTIMAFFTDLGVPAVWAYNQDVGGRISGSILGWGNMFGCFAASASPIVLNAIIAASSWDMMFLTCAASLGIAGFTALGVNACSSVVD